MTPLLKIYRSFKVCLRFKIYLSFKDWYPKVSTGVVYKYYVIIPFIVIRYRRPGFIPVKPNSTYRIEGWYEY